MSDEVSEAGRRLNAILERSDSVQDRALARKALDEFGSFSPGSPDSEDFENRRILALLAGGVSRSEIAAFVQRLGAEQRSRAH